MATRIVCNNTECRHNYRNWCALDTLKLHRVNRAQLLCEQYEHHDRKASDND